VLLASSGFCAAIIHDFVARPRSLSFIVSALSPELVAGLPNHRPAASPTEGATSTSAANEPAIASTTTPTPLPAAMTSSSSSLPQVSITDPGNSSESAKSEDDSKAKEEKNEKGNENEEEQEAEEASKTLLDNFPEILHQLNDGDTTTAGGPASGDGLRKREQNKRQRMNAAVKQVTELLRRVLDALQLYEGALDEADVAPDSGSSGDQGDEQHRRARWERNASLTRLKEQLAGWLRKSEARIPRITRNLSFTTLSEGEMALYLRQWKSLRRQRNQRKRKRTALSLEPQRTTHRTRTAAHAHIAHTAAHIHTPTCVIVGLHQVARRLRRTSSRRRRRRSRRRSGSTSSGRAWRVRGSIPARCAVCACGLCVCV
jgi:hypothetical protein